MRRAARCSSPPAPASACRSIPPSKGASAGMAEPLDDPSVPWLWQRARRSPLALGLRADGRDFSYGELAERCEATARRLRARGVGAGDRVAVLVSGSVRFVELVHAVQRLQATLVPLNVRLTGAEVAELLE